MRPRHVGKTAVRDILQTAGDASGPVVLHIGYVDDLGAPLGNHVRKVGARIFLAEEIHVHVRVRIVVDDRSTPAFGGPDVHAGRDEPVVMHRIHLVLEALIDPDLLRLHAHESQVAHDLRHHFGSRHNARRTRAVYLDAHHVRGCEKARPAVARIFVTGERAHALRNHFTHCRDVYLLGIRIDGFLGVHLSHFARIEPRHARMGGGLEPARHAIFGQILVQAGTERHRSRRCGLQERATYHTVDDKSVWAGDRVRRCALGRTFTVPRYATATRYLSRILS